MQENQFQFLMRQARIMGVANAVDGEFLAGYQRGLRRAFFGERFGTEEEHRLWLSLVNRVDPISQLRGKGYRAGLQGESLVLK